MDQYDNVLFYDDVRIIDDQRFTLAKREKKWDLVIHDVEQRDQGRYRCVANTSPIKLKYYELVIFGTYLQYIIDLITIIVLNL